MWNNPKEFESLISAGLVFSPEIVKEKFMMSKWHHAGPALKAIRVWIY